MGEPEAERAADVYLAGLEPRSGGRLLRSARLFAAFVSELAWGLLPAPSVSDVVVRRRDDGSEVLRVEAGNPNVPGDMLRFVQGQLEELDPGAFLAGWRAPGSPRG
jgi:hypothetical protein